MGTKRPTLPIEEHVEAVEADDEPEVLEERLERSMALRLEGWLARRSKGFVLVVGILLLALIGLVDAVTGAFAVEVFYLLPIGLVTFGRGRLMGLLVAGIASIGWSAIDVLQEQTSLRQSVTYWNALTRFYGYAAIVLLIAPMRDAMVMQRRRAEREAGVADQLRAMSELRDMALQTEFESRSLHVDSRSPGDPPGEDSDGELLTALTALDHDVGAD